MYGCVVWPNAHHHSIDVTLAEQVTPADEMRFRLAAVSYGQDVHEALACNVCGFVQIASVEVDAQRVSLLAPCPGRLPSTLMLVSEISCLDQP